jgi:hypothetical protein
MASYLYPLSDECGTTAPWEDTDARKTPIDRRQKAKVKNEKLKSSKPRNNSQKQGQKKEDVL